MSDALEISSVSALRKAIAGLADNTPILAQVIATNGDAWNLFVEFTAYPTSIIGAAVLQLKHEKLERLPPAAFDSAQESMRKITTVAGLEMFAKYHPHPLDTDASLSHCPFCGHEGAFNDGERRGQSDNYTVAVVCSNTSYGVRTPQHYKTREAVAIAWNRRV